MAEEPKGSPMKGVLIVVLVLVAGVAIYLAATQASKPPAPPTTKVAQGDGVGPQPYIDTDLSKKGVPAPRDEAKFHVAVQLDKVKGRNTFTFTVTEEHGWAANGVYVELRHEGLPENLEGRGKVKDRRLPIFCDKAPLRFGETLKHTATVQSHEFPEITDFGTSENWRAEVSNYSDLTAPKP